MVHCLYFPGSIFNLSDSERFFFWLLSRYCFKSIHFIYEWILQSSNLIVQIFIIMSVSFNCWILLGCFFWYIWLIYFFMYWQCIITNTVIESRYCVFDFVENISLLGNSIYILLISSNSLEFSDYISKLYSKFQYNYFDTPTLELEPWSNCACANCDYLLLHTIYEFLHMIRDWNLHWGYSLMDEVDQWLH